MTIIFFKRKISSVDEYVKKFEPLCIGGGEVNHTAAVEKGLEFLRKL
jgi:hypothetical protein